MPKLPRLTAQEAEKLVFAAGFVLVRSKGSHRIYMRNTERVVIPFHSGKILHPKIVKQVVDALSPHDDAQDI
ncbi:MAG: type II toxin-antitoxin system HicA family toxin [Myxacorys chilensis ATA2-1-KO14]|nr:type II toxin-antitoxin system HicA family toxin [Myxacorys chilensis ATA2-1-KO14]